MRKVRKLKIHHSNFGAFKSVEMHPKSVDILTNADGDDHFRPISCSRFLKHSFCASIAILYEMFLMNVF